MQDYLDSLSYSKRTGTGNRGFHRQEQSLEQLPYLPASIEELKETLFRVCFEYFPPMMLEELWRQKKEHLCYRLNYFTSLQLGVMLESYNFIVGVAEKDLHSLRSSMKRELESMFTHQCDLLFNLATHQVVALVDQGEYLPEGLNLPPAP